MDEQRVWQHDPLWQNNPIWQHQFAVLKRLLRESSANKPLKAFVSPWPRSTKDPLPATELEFHTESLLAVLR
ncbi:MAG TPA: hypothetical protein VG326_10900 [Tepidisphaeraceae bacterium]|jgi:hypothetical protein|nr:hypothetical protein [Tepidisphaeraceae bacterium]